MKLYLRLNPFGSGDSAEHYYHTHHKFTVEIAGEKICYVLCPNKLLEERGDGSHLGFQEYGHLFVFRDLHCTVVPFAALYLFYQSLNSEELAQKFGPALGDLEESEKNGIFLASVLDLAKNYLRSKEMADFVSRVTVERNVDSKIRESLLGKIIASYNVPSGESTAVALREQSSLDFYVQKTSEYVEAYHKNVWVRRSQELLDLAQSLGKSSLALQKYNICGCDLTYKEILADPLLRSNVSGVLEYVSQLEEMPRGTVLEAGETESRLLYLCSSDITESQRPPLRFLKNQIGKTGTNQVQLNGLSKKFFHSLKIRLMKCVLDDYHLANRALEGVKEVVLKLDSGDQDLVTKINLHLQEYRLLLASNTAQGSAETVVASVQEALVPYVNPEEVAKESLGSLARALDEKKTALAEIVTFTPKTTRDLTEALKTRASLQSLGCSTEEIDALIAKLTAASQEVLQSLKCGSSSDDPKRLG